MPQIRKIEVKHFRALKDFVWFPTGGLNCIIGSGDSGKSTVLDAIDMTLGAKRVFSFSDADFYQLDTTIPIEISITLGDLDDELKDIEIYGNFLRGFDSSTSTVVDEPKFEYETVITLKLTVREDLNPDWRLYSDRAEAENYERRLIWKHRELIASTRLDETSNYHLSWGNRSILNKFSEDAFDVTSTLADIFKQVRDSFSTNQPDELSGVLEKIKVIGNMLGIPLTTLKAQLDTKKFPLSGGAIGLHAEDNTPLNQLGSGSARLLVSGLHKASSKSKILIIDEVDHGLEPFRISRLLHELGSKDTQPSKQIFITTHSPYVVRELRAEQLFVIRPMLNQELILKDSQPSHKILQLNKGTQPQATLRSCTEAFLSKKVIVCEGKTEIGLIRGIDLYFKEVRESSIYMHGTYCTDGGGDNMFERAKIFLNLEYPTAIFKDADKSTPADCEVITIFEWKSGFATEDAIFNHCPARVIKSLVEAAIKFKSIDSINAHIKNCSNNELNLDNYLQLVETDSDNVRNTLAKAAKAKSWFKDIEPAEYIAYTIIAPNFDEFSSEFTQVIDKLLNFAKNQVS